MTTTTRVRPLTKHEENAIRVADDLRLTLERLRDDPPGDKADRECVADALDWLGNVEHCLRDIAIVDPPEDDASDVTGPRLECSHCGESSTSLLLTDDAGNVTCSTCGGTSRRTGP